MAGALQGRIAVVAGATRGAGRGIARMLGAQGAVVYCSGRSVKGKVPVPGVGPFAAEGRAETIDETAAMVTALGGTGIPVQTDHAQEDQVQRLFARVQRDHGQLDILVNDIWGAEELAHASGTFWESDPLQGWAIMERAVRTHVITARHGLPLMVARKHGVLFEVTDGDAFYWRHNFFYDLAKMTVMRMAFSLAQELRPHNVAAVAVTPGFLRSEAMLEHFGVTPETWMEQAARDPNFAHSETPGFVGRGVAALAADPKLMRWSGKAVASWTLARHFNLVDEDGRRPDWGTHFATSTDPMMVEVRAQHQASHTAYVHMGDLPEDQG